MDNKIFKPIMKKFIKKYKSEISTLAGLLMAIGTAWSTIDFTTFDVKRDWVKLFLSGMIAVGGYITKLNVEDNETK